MILSLIFSCLYYKFLERFISVLVTMIHFKKLKLLINCIFMRNGCNVLTKDVYEHDNMWIRMFLLWEIKIKSLIAWSIVDEIPISLLCFKSLCYVELMFFLYTCIEYDVIWLWTDIIEFLHLIVFKMKEVPSNDECCLSGG